MRRMRLRLPELQKSNPATKELKKDLLEDWEDMESILYYQDFSYNPEIVCFKMISCHHNNLLAGYFRIKKTKELVTKKTLLIYLPSRR